jgi:outer membrane receptor protein involved in Fe transport
MHRHGGMLSISFAIWTVAHGLCAAPLHALELIDDRPVNSPVIMWLRDADTALSLGVPTPGFVQPAQFQPPVVPEPSLRVPIPGRQPPGSGLPTAELRRSFGLVVGELATTPDRQQRLIGASVDVVNGAEAMVLPVTFAGSLFSKSASTSGIQSIRRSPVVSDSRLRGQRSGQTLTSGSFWVPARMDLDTMFSKIDARLIEDMIIVKGPYSVLNGPGLSFVDMQLLRSPRYESGPDGRGSTSVEYQTNGQQWFGKQSLSAGSDNWGTEVVYGQRTGNDYLSGNGTELPASYKSRDLYVASGCDIDENSQLEFSYLRLDETDVEFPGQAFDMNFLVTDGFDLEYEVRNTQHFDRGTLDAWYNRTRFAGDAQRAGKRRQFPIYDDIDFIGMTDVDSMSTGFRQLLVWGDDTSDHVTAGVDFRYIKQELNEITSGDLGGVSFWADANSPIPQSHSSNPGLLLESTRAFGDALRLRAGARVDWISANVDDNPAKLAAVGTFPPGLQPSYDQVVGSSDYDQDFALWAIYLSGEQSIDENWTLLASAGQGQRAPTLTELYAAEPFMFLLQNGLNSVTGDPLLNVERAWQIDVGAKYVKGPLRWRVNGYHAWVLDYITFENMSVQPSATAPEQVQLKFVNTDLATLVGGELNAEYDLANYFTPYATVSYITGRDHTRNGSFATQPVSSGAPSVRVAGVPRGNFSGVAGAAEEPLPSIPPLESRLGLRLSPPESPDWSIDLYVRLVDDQHRVASSLLEQPTPGFGVLNVRGFWHVNDHWLVMGGVENMGDRNYREHLDYRPIVPGSSLPVFEPGVSFYAGSELVY